MARRHREGSSDRWAEARSHMVLKESIRCLEFSVSFSTLALLPFEAADFFVVGAVSCIADPCCNCFLHPEF